MNITGRPIFQKPERAPDDPAYLAKVRALPCIICEEFGHRQTSPTTAHHCIMGRHGTRKRPDRMAIPLCDGHHQGTFDKSKVAIHREPKRWEGLHGPDVDWIAPTQDKIERTWK